MFINTLTYEVNNPYIRTYRTLIYLLIEPVTHVHPNFFGKNGIRKILTIIHVCVNLNNREGLTGKIVMLY